MTAEQTTPVSTESDEPGYRIGFPSAADSALAQDEEWCVVKYPDGGEQRLRFHDYSEIYPHPGLYEQLFYERLECSSPETVVGLLDDQLKDNDVDAAQLSVLDLGAGNGMVGEQLQSIGAGTIVGVDIIDEAGEAAARDRPGVYDEYLVEDLTALGAESEEQLRDRDLNALTCVAALGFGDIPPLAFATAYDLIESGGWLAFNIRDEFLQSGGGFARLIREMRGDGWIEELDSERYVHRRSSVDDEPLYYVAMVARKRGRGSARERVRTIEAASQ